MPGDWRYEITRNPDDPEHLDRMNWLGLDTASGFDLERFGGARSGKVCSRCND
jgi:hypothetical protein